MSNFWSMSIIIMELSNRQVYRVLCVLFGIALSFGVWNGIVEYVCALNCIRMESMNSFVHVN